MMHRAFQHKQTLFSKIVKACAFAVLLLGAIAPSVAQSPKDVILSIGDHHFGTDEFQYFYKKNNSQMNDDAKMLSPQEYMELFINFKLKVLAGEQMGLDTLASFMNELKGYRDELAKPYLTHVKFNDEMLQTAYYRTKHERKASHVLVQINEGRDSLQALARIQEIRQKWEAGADFNELAFQYSDDPSARMNRGELGYFSAFMMVYPFEDAAYKTPIGQVSQPVRTQFGYHLVRVEDERESKGQIAVAHIMKRLPEPGNDDGHGHAHAYRSEASLKSEMDSLYQLLQQGADFTSLAQEYSDDQYSARNGGQLQPFTESRMVPEFSQAAFALQNDGDISPVIRSPYGWHIIKRIKRIPVPQLDEISDQLREQIRKNPQISQHSRELFISELKKEYSFEMNTAIESELPKNLKTLISGETAMPGNIDLQAVLCSFGDEKVSVGDFISFLKAKNTNTVQPNQLLSDFVEDCLVRYENERLESKHPDFAMLMKEYHDGMLLFAVSEKMIWNKAAEDTLGLERFYEKNKSKYLGDEKFEGWVIKCRDFETRSKVDEILAQEPVDKQELLSIMNARNGGGVAVIDGVFKKGENPVVDFYVWNASRPAGLDEKITYVRGNKMSPEPKTLDESRGLHIADYQSELETQWLADLHKQNRIRVNKKLVKQISSLK